MHRPLLTQTTSSRGSSQVTRRQQRHSLIAGPFPVVSILVRRIAFPLLLLMAGLLLVQPSAGQSGTWEETGSLTTARGNHTTTLLPNGSVLAAGGYNMISGHLANAELYNSATGTWTETGNLNTARDTHTATLLSNGKVLVAGGADSSFNPLASAEVYDPASGMWTLTGSLPEPRSDHAATLLANGKVLVVGGAGSTRLASADLYDPATGTWTATGSMTTARESPTATLLPDGRVLVACGLDSRAHYLRTAELYDPVTGTWTPTGSLADGRLGHTSTLLPNGKVLVAAGFNSHHGGLTSAELYDPASGTWTSTGSLTYARFGPTATLLPDGKVLIAGSAGIEIAELYDPVTGTWTTTGSLNTARYLHAATLLPNGKVLVTGGFGITGGGNGDYLASAELYTSDGGGEVTLVSAASRMTHGSAGSFDIDMPLTGPSGVEDRQEPPNGGKERKTFLAVFTFDTPVTSGDVSVTGGNAFAGTPIFSGNEIQVPLLDVSGGQVVTLTVSNVNGLGGSADVDFGFLVGDVNGDRVVDKADADLIESHKHQAVDGSNFRDDINLNGVVGVPDFNYVRAHKNTHL